MKYLFLLTIFLFGMTSAAQSEGQTFCGGDPEASYFTLHRGTKYVVWQNTYYVEKNLGTKTIDGVEYTHYNQTWENESSQDMYLRADNGIVFQFEECCEDDTIRLTAEPKVGQTWETVDKLSTYEIMSLDGTLDTPVCNYEALLVLKSTFKNGTFTFYYQKGYGYVGATIDNQLISFVIPRLPKD